MNSKLGKAAWTALLAGAVFVSGTHAQSEPEDADVRFVAADGSVGTSFIGDDVRVSIGIDDEGDVHGEYFHVFGETDYSNWIGELWVSDERGGVKLNYHWLRGAESLEEAAARQDRVRISKVFAAVDQNEFDDRKASFGYGQEGPKFFWSAYLTAAITDERQTAQEFETLVRQITGVDGNQEFVQDEITTITTTTFEHPYDYGVGVRVGRFFDNSLVRLRGGLDYEKGEFSSNQTTLSVGLEKYFANTGHSLALDLERYEKDGDFEIDDSDTRAILYYRYSFGERYRPSRNYVERRVTSVVPAAGSGTQVDAEPEMRLVRNRVTIERDALFDFDRSFIRPGEAQMLSELADRIEQLEVVGDVEVVGHTCDIGTDQYNQGLSERRANSVADFLVEQGLSRSEMSVRAMGETQPKVPNTSEANRKLNRRTEIEFVTLEERREPVASDKVEELPEETRVTWEREEIDDPAWLQRALRNSIRHKRTVDTYRYQTEEVDVELGPRQIINTLPSASDDAAQTFFDTPVTVNVLANDSDPDGDPLSVVDTTLPANGTVSVGGDGSITYTPMSGFSGEDSFVYTIEDSNGAQATATVTITVLEIPPIEANDDSAETDRGQPVTIDVLANDTGDDLEVVAIDQPDNGTVADNGDGTVTFTPASGFVGTAQFGYTIEDSFDQQATASVTVTVNMGENNPPIAVDDFATTQKNTAVIIDVLANDSDPDGDPLTIIEVPAKTPMGTAEITEDGQILYNPMPGWWGGDSFEYTISDGFGGTATATVTLDVRF